MLRLSPQKQIIAWLGTTCIVLGAAIVLYATVLKAQLGTSTTAIQDALLAIALNSQRQQNYSTQSKQIATIQDQTQQLNQSFFNRAKAIDFVDYFENLATQNDVTQDLQVSEPSRTSPNTPGTFSVEEKSYSAALKGTAPNLLRFFSALESNPAYILTTTVSFSQNEDGSAALTLNGTIPWQ